MRVPVAHSPFYGSIPSSSIPLHQIFYSYHTVSNALVTSLVLRMFMVGSDHLLSNGSPTGFPFDYAIEGKRVDEPLDYIEKQIVEHKSIESGCVHESSKADTGIEIENLTKVEIDRETKIKIKSMTGTGMRTNIEVRVESGTGDEMKPESQFT
ncbi:hypothetical protein EVAR_28271_1 [Eumeta japonica]|uniref:Uncharacterized protein n=1 Tax=Eumeta variegata TaxID=151549 RepID=A0A4C1V6T3_EUMVA|nr:hypothetical protein EVAR_28271_1 [Eumeta japonica]